MKIFLTAIYSKIGQIPPLNKNNNGKKLGASSSKHKDIKDWINEKKEVYKKEIFDAIEALKPVESLKSVAVLPPAAAPAASLKSAAAVLPQAAAPAAGGSRKKYKKSPVVGGSRKKSKNSRS